MSVSVLKNLILRKKHVILGKVIEQGEKMSKVRTVDLIRTMPTRVTSPKPYNIQISTTKSSIVKYLRRL